MPALSATLSLELSLKLALSLSLFLSLVFVCPPKAIRITPGSVPEEEEDREHVEKAPEEFEINMLRCIYCGYCQEVCPEEAIFLQEEYSSSGYSREEMINNKAKLYQLGGTLPDQHYKWDKKKEAEDVGNSH